MTQKPKPNKRTAASERARRRAKDIYVETLRASGGKPPSDQSIRDTLAREGHKYCTTALIGQWRRNDKWAERCSAGTVLLTYEANAELPLDNITLAMVKSIRLYTKLTGVLSNWLANFDPVTMTMADGLKAVQLVAPSLESLAALRVEIGEQRMKEAEDVTPSSVRVAQAAPEIRSTLDMLSESLSLMAKKAR
jgi:hypothetical protein